jgi:hypothetical protein
MTALHFNLGLSAGINVHARRSFPGFIDKVLATGESVIWTPLVIFTMY